VALPASGAKLGKSNSVPIEFLSVKPFELAGSGCGSSATGSVTLAKPPKGVSKAYAFKIVKPKVGDRDGFVRVTGVAVNDQTISVTAVAELAECTAQSADGSWSARFDPDISFTRRVQGRVRPDLDRKRPVLKPRKLRIPGGGTLKGIRWKSYGGKTASGTATYNDELPGTRTRRVKIKLLRIRRCPPYGLFEYTTLKIRGTLQTGNIC
jgi:hypothetical protein